VLGVGQEAGRRDRSQHYQLSKSEMEQRVIYIYNKNLRIDLTEFTIIIQTFEKFVEGSRLSGTAHFMKFS
jgi:hypothetical protein